MSLASSFNKFTPESMLKLVRLQMPQVISNKIASVYPSNASPSSYTVKFDYFDEALLLEEEEKFEKINNEYYL
jgi:hypothetical protein